MRRQDPHATGQEWRSETGFPAHIVTRMDIALSTCFIAVDDHDKALAFYRDVLGLEVRNDVGFEGMRWVTVGAPSQPDVEIVLEPPLADPNASPADKEAMAELLAKGLLRGVIFRTDDCDATFERIRAAGAEVLQEPIDQPYGVRDCAFRDPSGNMLRFNQPRAQ
jgi:predicted enzyme related to lactoylglutathione lyase